MFSFFSLQKADKYFVSILVLRILIFMGKDDPWKTNEMFSIMISLTSVPVRFGVTIEQSLHSFLCSSFAINSIPSLTQAHMLRIIVLELAVVGLVL